MAGFQLFAPLRAVGMVTSPTPFALQARGNDHFVTTSTGEAFHVYNTKHLNLVFVGSPGCPIEAIAVHGDFTFTACGTDVFAWIRGKKVREFKGHTSTVKQILPFGEHIVTISEDNIVRVFSVSSGELFSQLEDLTSLKFTATCVVHPSTYLNKILLGSREGQLQLWNIRTGALIYTFKGWGSPVTCIATAPVLDVVAVGLLNGRIAVANLKTDETLFTLSHNGGPVVALSFRTDGPATLASASAAGQVALWDLETRKLQSVLDAHNGAVSSMAFLASQAQLLTAGDDNALKLWVLDQPDGSARLLRSRSGHSAPPSLVRFHGEDSITLLTAGQDRTLRITSTVSDEFGCELSQGSVAKRSKALGVRTETLRLPAVVAFASESVREEDWDGIVTCHQGASYARTWSYKKKAIGAHTLEPSDETFGTIRTVAMSACGNFAILGSDRGRVQRFNVQSGLDRGEYGRPAHAGEVRGIASDAVSGVLLTCARDGRLCFWDFAKQRLLEAIALGTAAVGLALHRDSNMAAVALSDYRVVVVDADTRRTVRSFAEHSGRITDMAWSADGRWLLTASMDGAVRTWDMPTGRLLSAFRVADAVTSLALSPAGDMLATTHVNTLGVMLWANRSLYAAVDVRPLPPNIDVLELPLATAEAASVAWDSAPAAADFASPASMDGCITLSAVPRARWAVLPSLATVKERNKPVQPPRAPPTAPFFLPNTTALAPGALPQVDADAAGLQAKRKSRVGILGIAHSPFAEQVCASARSGQYESLLKMLAEMSPSSVDLEIRSLSPMISDHQLEGFVAFLAHLLQQQQCYELVQAYLHVFLDAHADAITNQPSLTAALKSLLQYERLEELFHKTACLTAFLGGTF